MFLAVIRKGIMCASCNLEPKLQQYSWFMHFQVKKPQNGKKNPFRDKETTTNKYLRFFDVKVLTETYLVHFGTLSTH